MHGNSDKQLEDKQTVERWEEYEETGEAVSNESMMEWLDSWGTDKEMSCPEK